MINIYNKAVMEVRKRGGLEMSDLFFSEHFLKNIALVTANTLN